jgi:transposase
MGGMAEGYPCLNQAGKATVHRILAENPPRPHKIAYYPERRDPESDRKMKEILMIYKEVRSTDLLSPADIVTVSVDEKPGVQAIRNRSPDILPDPTKNPRIMRDYEYERLGTVSILAALDLHDGHVIAQVHDRHRSIEFISLLKELDEYYPADCRIRLILDNHSAHISKETRAYLATKPNRFIYTHTPKHGSWLNPVETLFGKMARTFLKYIRVESKDELKKRILKGIEEIKMMPVVHQWKKFDVTVQY